jgi:hypothetical protein
VNLVVKYQICDAELIPVNWHSREQAQEQWKVEERGTSSFKSQEPSPKWYQSRLRKSGKSTEAVPDGAR